MKRTLFLVIKPPEGSLPPLLSGYSNESGILLLEDGILHALRQDTLAKLNATGMKLFALRDSVAARGFADRMPENVKVIDTAEVPKLIMEEYETSITL